MLGFVSWESVKAGLEFLRHSQAAFTVIVVGGSSVLTWYLTKRSYDNGDLRTRVEVIGFEPELQPDGTYLVDFPTHGDQMNLSQLVGLSRLERRIITATRRTKDGFLILHDARSQRLMMEILEDHVTGNDDRTHTEALAGLATLRVDIAFAPLYFYEADEDVSMIRIIKIAERYIPLLRDPETRGRFHARLPRKADFLEWSIAIAERADKPEQSVGGTAYIWRTTLKASLGGALHARERAA